MPDYELLPEYSMAIDIEKQPAKRDFTFEVKQIRDKKFQLTITTEIEVDQVNDTGEKVDFDDMSKAFAIFGLRQEIGKQNIPCDFNASDDVIYFTLGNQNIETDGKKGRSGGKFLTKNNLITLLKEMGLDIESLRVKKDY